MKTQNFIKKAKEKHGDRYDYSEVDYKKSTTEVTIGCNIHGNFKQTPTNHLRTGGCPKCSKGGSGDRTRLTLEEFIRRSREIHGDRYDYSLVNYTNARTKVKIICSVHGVFEQVPYGHMSGRGCRKCANEENALNQKITLEEFIRRSREAHGDRYDYSNTKYTNNKEKSAIICRIHGEFQQLPANHIKGHGCPTCAVIESAKRKTLPGEEIIKRFTEIHGNRYDYSKVKYRKRVDPVTIICRKHGEFSQTPSSHLKGSGCMLCGIDSSANAKYKTTADFIKKAKEKHGDRYDYSETNYVNSIEDVRIICKIHGEFMQSPGNHLQGKGCQSCADISRIESSMLTYDEFVRRSISIHGDRYDYSNSIYSGSKEKTRIICKDHGEFQQAAGSHLSGSGCPECAGIVPSKAEDMMAQEIASLGVQIERSNRTAIAPKELDIYLPDHKIGIEFNGLYWHSEKFLSNDYHQKKSLECMEKGIQLIHIWDDDWNDPTKKKIILEKIRSKCGILSSIYARKCKIDFDIPSDEIRDFLETNHIQGYIPSKYIGLRYHGELVAVLGMKRTKDEGVYDLTRFASSKSVVGGFSKLLSHWKKHNTWDKIITYAHLDYSHGNLYKVNGFTFDGYTKPNYFYTRHGQKRESRQKFMKHKLPSILKNFDPNLTERENMRNNRYLRVYDSGSMRFYLEND